MKRLVSPLLGFLVLGSMVYAGWTTSDWSSLIACLPAILVIAAVVGGLFAGVTFFGATEKLEFAAAPVRPLEAPIPLGRFPQDIYNARKIRARLAGVGEVPAKHARKKKRPQEVAHVLDSDCTGCGLCIPFCPSDCIEVEPAALWTDRSSPPVRIRYDECTGCGICMHVCEQLAWDAAVMRPTEAIEHELGIVIHDVPHERNRLPPGLSF
jgi:electron transport complex protein RnfB